MAEICSSLGYYCLEEVMGASAAEREPLYKPPANGRPAWARVLRKIPEPRAPPVETEGKPAFFEGVHVYAALRGIDTLNRIGVLYGRARRRPICFQHRPARQTAGPPYAAFLEPNLHAAPTAPQAAAHKRAAEQEQAPQKRGAVRTPVLHAAQLSLRYPRYIVADEVAGVKAWRYGGGANTPGSFVRTFLGATQRGCIALRRSAARVLGP